MNDSLFSLFSQTLELASPIYVLLSQLAFIWAPLFLGSIFWHFFMLWRRGTYIAREYPPVLLEILIPREILKSPASMEIVLEALYQSSSGTWLERYWHGRVHPWFSLELVSIEGAIHFYIRIPKKYRKIVEASIYGQYPGVEIVEAEDYVFGVDYHPKKKDWEIWGCEYKLNKADPYPIKTYVDYKLNDTQMKEEQKADPMLTIIEFLGSVGIGQQMWFQILIQATKDRYPVSGSFFQKQGWKDEGKKVIKGLREKTKGENGERLTKREEEIIYAIERSISKHGFDTGIRGLYLAKDGTFDGGNIGAFFNVFRHFNSIDLNGFSPVHTTAFDFPWEDIADYRLHKRKYHLFESYVNRGYFYRPFKGHPFVLNTEELATIFHFPGQVASTPTFTRIDSKKSEPPSNLPI